MSATPVPLSWQQRLSVAGDEPGPPNLAAMVPVGLDASHDQLRSLARAAVRGVEALRIRVTGPGTAEILDPDDVADPPLCPVERYGSETALREQLQRVVRTTSFDRSRAPLCQVTPYELVGDDAAVTHRWLVFHVDHLVADAVSVQLFKDACASEPVSFAALGGYGAWLRQQDVRFRDDSDPAAEFWRDHLEGADLAVCDQWDARIAGADGYGEQVTVCARALATTGLEQLCAEQGVTPFMALMASVVQATSAATGSTHTTLVLSTHGRDASSVDVFGYLANIVPVHVPVPPGAEPVDVLEEVATAVLETTSFCNTPWPYLHRVLGYDHPNALGESTVVLNHVTQFALTPTELAEIDGASMPGVESGLWVDVVGIDDGGLGLLVKFDPTRYTAAGVAAWADDVVAGWDRLLAPDPTPRSDDAP